MDRMSGSVNVAKDRRLLKYATLKTKNMNWTSLGTRDNRGGTHGRRGRGFPTRSCHRLARIEAREHLPHLGSDRSGYHMIMLVKLVVGHYIMKKIEESQCE